jgi:hypothetical protein
MNTGGSLRRKTGSNRQNNLKFAEGALTGEDGTTETGKNYINITTNRTNTTDLYFDIPFVFSFVCVVREVRG